jgi:hypothetical protein
MQLGEGHVPRVGSPPEVVHGHVAHQVSPRHYLKPTSRASIHVYDGQLPPLIRANCYVLTVGGDAGYGAEEAREVVRARANARACQNRGQAVISVERHPVVSSRLLKHAGRAREASFQALRQAHPSTGGGLPDQLELRC